MSSPVSMSLRTATEEDISTVLAIERQVHVSPWTEEHFRSELEKPYSHFLLMTDDETDTQVAGYIVFWLMFDECQILNVVVDLPYRGLGLAKDMLRQVVHVAIRKGTKRISLEVRKSNQAALQLYQSAGFVIRQVRRQFYSNGEDAYQMVLSLEGERIDF